MGYPWNMRPHRWVLLISWIVGFIGLLGGIFSGNVDIMIGGAVWLVVTSSAYLVFYVKSERG
jgi:ABC-type Mn2+/Zn2+ transport system permease subunit